jgi:hypothetical protein
MPVPAQYTLLLAPASPAYDPLRDDDYSPGANPIKYNVSDSEFEGSEYASNESGRRPQKSVQWDSVR